MLNRFLASGLVISAVFAHPTAVEECSLTSSQPCKCPENTDYQTCTTYINVGANAFDVRNLTGNYYDLSWIPQKILSKDGPDNTIGSTRTTVIGIDVGVYEWVEEMTRYELATDGSFLWAFRLVNVPIYFDPGPGLFAGEWVSFKGEYVSEHETKISWNLYGCHSGGMHRYSEFQRIILRHVRSLLAKSGKIQGSNTDPYTEIGIPRNITLTKVAAKIDATAFERTQHILSASSRGRSSAAWTAL